MQTLFTFTLPKGYLDENGTIHRDGTMRLATAKDEIEAISHPKARAMSEYTSILLLAKVIVKLEGVDEVTDDLVASLYSTDVNFLQNMYETINRDDDVRIHVVCPHCGKEFDEPLNFSQVE